MQIWPTSIPDQSSDESDVMPDWSPLTENISFNTLGFNGGLCIKMGNGINVRQLLWLVEVGGGRVEGEGGRGRGGGGRGGGLKGGKRRIEEH